MSMSSSSHRHVLAAAALRRCSMYHHPTRTTCSQTKLFDKSSLVSHWRGVKRNQDTSSLRGFGTVPTTTSANHLRLIGGLGAGPPAPPRCSRGRFAVGVSRFSSSDASSLPPPPPPTANDPVVVEGGRSSAPTDKKNSALTDTTDRINTTTEECAPDDGGPSLVSLQTSSGGGDEDVLRNEVATVCNRARQINAMATLAMTSFRSGAQAAAAGQQHRHRPSNSETALDRLLMEHCDTPDPDGRKISVDNESSAKKAEEAADTLLSLLARPTFVNAWTELGYHDNLEIVETKHKLTLHSSILSVIQWCLFFPSSLTQKTVELSIRGENLGMPPHLPLYHQLAITSATAPASSLFDIAASAQRSIYPSMLSDVMPNFFVGPLVHMVRSGQYSDATEVITKMGTTMDTHTARMLFFLVNERRRQRRGSDQEEDDEDMARLLFVLYDMLPQGDERDDNDRLGSRMVGSIVPRDDDDGSIGGRVGELVDDALNDLSSTAAIIDDGYDSDATCFDVSDDGDWDELDDDDDEPVELEVSGSIPFNEGGIGHDVTLLKAAAAAEEEEEATASSASSVMDKSRGLSLMDRVHQDKADDMIYIRDGSGAWTIPDVTEQVVLMGLNENSSHGSKKRAKTTDGGVRLFYTREYEEELLRQMGMMSEEGDDVYSSDEFGISDDDDNDDDDGDEEY